jgi:hypothetical protein
MLTLLAATRDATSDGLHLSTGAESPLVLHAAPAVLLTLLHTAIPPFHSSTHHATPRNCLNLLKLLTSL